MPEPKSTRGMAVTPADLTVPFDTPIVPFGNAGLNVAAAIDAVKSDQFTRLTNVVFTPGGSREVTIRPGQVELASFAASPVHSAHRFADPFNSTATRVWGVGSELALGLDGAVSSVDSGYSGNPLVLVPHRPTLSGTPWMYVADLYKMSKVAIDGTVKPIGLPAPTLALTTSMGADQETVIAPFGGGGATAGPNWTPNAGKDFSNPPLDTGVPLPGTDATIVLVSDPGGDVLAAGNGWWQFWGLAYTLDLSMVGSRAADDNDVMKLTIKIGNPAACAEVRLYVVVDELFSPSILPGSSPEANQDFYVKTFRPDDFTPFIQSQTSQIINAEIARVNTIRDNALDAASTAEGYAAARDQSVQRIDTQFLETQDPARAAGVTVGGSTTQFVELGTIGVPLRRGDWQRYGNTVGRGWGTVTGLIVYIQAGPTPAEGTQLPFVDVYGWALTGGYGPDTMDAATQSYDYRATNYDPATGAESNPSPIMDGVNWVDALRQAVVVAPAAYGGGGIIQRLYRRGGTLVNDWYYLGANESDGAAFTDEATDLSIAAAGTLAIDHYQPVPTVDNDGNTVLAQPVGCLFGPMNGQLFALGDPYRPGYVYACIPGQPDHWPPDLTNEVCAPSEQLMAGFIYGGQAFAFSRERLYVLYQNMTGPGGITSTPTECREGLAGRWAYALGLGSIWFWSPDGPRRTSGSAAEYIGTDVMPLFQGTTVNGYQPVDFSAEAALRVCVFEQEVWFQYQDTQGAANVLIYQALSQTWRHYEFGWPTAVITPDLGNPVDTLLMGSRDAALAYTHDGTTDAGSSIAWRARTGTFDGGRPREEKLFGDLIIDFVGLEDPFSITPYLNADTIVDASVTFTGGSTRERGYLDAFGTLPQRAHSIAAHFAGESRAGGPVLYYWGVSVAPQPELTLNRATQWDDFGHPDESYVMGVTLDCDTQGADLTVFIDADFGGVTSTLATITVNTNGRHKQKFSWPGLPAHKVRIRPQNDCGPWILYRVDWIFQPEPPRIARWDAFFEMDWDQYYTGLDLYCDTGGLTKLIVVEVDGTPLVDPATGLAYWAILTAGRRVVHLTLPTGRGHVLRFYATDDNPGLLYTHRWHTDAEPSEQANWNQPYTILGTQADKWLKGIVFEVDTFALDKTVRVEADGVVATTVTVNADGRKVVQVAIPQILGRVWRFIPSDANPSRLYTLRPIFDEEPFALTRWETQEVDHGVNGFYTLIDAMITLKSNGPVTLTITTIINQATGAAVTDDYVIPTTGGVKRKVWVPFLDRKGVLTKYLFTGDAFWLYREESQVTLQPWQGGSAVVRQPFGNDDLDPTRGMTNATLAASRSGGSA
jgi:hypothetical protein